MHPGLSGDEASRGRTNISDHTLDRAQQIQLVLRPVSGLRSARGRILLFDRVAVTARETQKSKNNNP